MMNLILCLKIDFQTIQNFWIDKDITIALTNMNAYFAQVMFFRIQTSLLKWKLRLQITHALPDKSTLFILANTITRVFGMKKPNLAHSLS